MIDRETVAALRECGEMLGLGRAEIAECRLLEFQHEGRCQRAVGLEEIEALREIGRIAERGRGDVAEHADVLVAHHQAAQHLHTAQHHHVIDAPDQSAGFGDGDEIVGGQHLVLVVAQPRHRLVETHLALRQRHHRLQVDVEPVFLDGVLDRGKELRLVARRRGGGLCRRGIGRRCRFGSGRCRGGDRRRLGALRCCLRCFGTDERQFVRQFRGRCGCGSRGHGAGGQQIVMARNRGRELLDQHAEFVDLADHGLDAVGPRRVCRHDPPLDGSQPPAEFGDLAGEVGGAA